MGTNGINFLKEHESKEQPKFEADAAWENRNASWLKWSRNIAVSISNYMQKNNLTRVDIAEKLDEPQQYVSKILSGSFDFTLKDIVLLQNRLGIKIIAHA